MIPTKSLIVTERKRPQQITQRKQRSFQKASRPGRLHISACLTFMFDIQFSKQRKPICQTQPNLVGLIEQYCKTCFQQIPGSGGTGQTRTDCQMLRKRLQEVGDQRDARHPERRIVVGTQKVNTCTTRGSRAFRANPAWGSGEEDSGMVGFRQRGVHRLNVHDGNSASGSGNVNNDDDHAAQSTMAMRKSLQPCAGSAKSAKWNQVFERLFTLDR